MLGDGNRLYAANHGEGRASAIRRAPFAALRVCIQCAMRKRHVTLQVNATLERSGKPRRQTVVVAFAIAACVVPGPNDSAADVDQQRVTAP